MKERRKRDDRRENLHKVNRKSEALQYLILHRGEDWSIEPAHPSFPRTPDEDLVIEIAKRMFDVDDEERMIIPEPTREYLNASPGDIVSLTIIIESQLEATKDVFDSYLESLKRFRDQIIELDSPDESDSKNDNK